jgi:hypothetical protein
VTNTALRDGDQARRQSPIATADSATCNFDKATSTSTWAGSGSVKIGSVRPRSTSPPTTALVFEISALSALPASVGGASPHSASVRLFRETGSKPGNYEVGEQQATLTSWEEVVHPPAQQLDGEGPA